MCKKGLINKIKDLSKYVPKSTNNIKTNNEINNRLPIQNKEKMTQEKTNQIFNQTKRQLNSKTQILRNYAQKAKELSEKAKESVTKTTSTVINSATQIKKKIEQGARSGQEIASKSKEKLLNSTKQGINFSQQILSKKVEQIKSSAGDLKQKIVQSKILRQKKSSIQGLKQNIKQNVKQKFKQSQNLISKSAEGLNKAKNNLIQKASQRKQPLPQIDSKLRQGVQSTKSNLQKNLQGIFKNKNQYTKNLIQATKQELKSQKPLKEMKSKSQVIQLSKKILTQYTPKKEQYKNQEKNDIKFNYYQKIWQKIKKSNDSLFGNLLIKNTKSKFSNMLTNMYWRLIFGACLIVFAFGISTQLPRQIRLHISEKNKLQKQQQNILRAQKQTEAQVRKSNY